MGKPISRIAWFIWAVAALVTLSQIIVEPIIHSMTLAAAPEFARPEGHLVMALWFFNTIRGGIVTATMLVAVGAIVELLDQIRWNALPPDQRDKVPRLRL